MIMKKLYRILASVLALLLIAGVFSGCGENGKAAVQETYAGYTDLATSAVFTDREGKTHKSFGLRGSAESNTYITVDLGETKAFNTVVVRESGKHVTLFELYGSNSPDKDFDFLYQSDCIEGGHTCFLGDVQYRYLRLFVNQASSSFRLTDFEVYNIKSKTAKDLRVTAYLIVNNITEKADFSMLDGVTDIILFGTAKFDGNGDIRFVDDSGKETGEADYTKRVALLRKAIGDRKINLIVDVAMPYGEGNTDINSMLSDEKVDHTVESVQKLVEKYDFDGYDMDYEFPSNKQEWKQFNTFLRKMDAALGDRLLSIAVAPWDLQFDEDVIAAIDRAEVMLYDMFTAHGYHSIFPVTANGIRKMLKGGFSAGQLDLGVPFYSRPTNRLGYWGNYNQYAGKLDRYTNLLYFNDFDHDGNPMTAPQYINSVQMIADKTAYAVDAGLGGIMVWHMSCDLPYDQPLSLFKSISDTKAAKQQ